MTILVQITPVVHGFRHHETIKRFDTLEDAKAFVREQYRGCKSTGPIYCDSKSRGTIKTGRTYRVPSEGLHWVTFSRVISETERAIESIDIDKAA